ncbi:MAG TPA: hypothetical protein PK530_19905 [Anaerolineales bacterium]|nr:hypothetical protein [Anaerolineales bacterium]
MILAKCCHDLDIRGCWMRSVNRCPAWADYCTTVQKTPPKAHPPAVWMAVPSQKPVLRPVHLHGPAPSLARHCRNRERDSETAQTQTRAPEMVRFLSRFYPDLRLISDYRGWPISVVAHDPTPENLRAALQAGPYGRCVTAITTWWIIKSSPCSSPAGNRSR